MLSIRNPKAAKLARELAARRGVTMTDAIVSALENELERAREESSLSERLAGLARELAMKAGPNRRAVGKDEIDAMWGC